MREVTENVIVVSLLAGSVLAIILANVMGIGLPEAGIAAGSLVVMALVSVYSYLEEGDLIPFLSGLLTVGLIMGSAYVFVGPQVLGMERGHGSDAVYEKVSKGKILESGKLWSFEDHPFGPWNDSVFKARLAGSTKVKDWKYEETAKDGEVEEVWRWKSKVLVSESHEFEQFGLGDFIEDATFKVTPPTYTYRSESGEGLSQTSFSPIRADVSSSGDVSVNPPTIGVSGNTFTLIFDTAHRGGRGTATITVIFEKTVTRQKGQETHNPGGGEGEGLPVPAWAIALLAAPVVGVVAFYGSRFKGWKRK